MNCMDQLTNISWHTLSNDNTQLPYIHRLVAESGATARVCVQHRDSTRGCGFIKDGGNLDKSLRATFYTCF